jgi:hypothetical protein
MTKSRFDTVAGACVAVLLVGLAACDGKTPVTPTSPSPSPPPVTRSTVIGDASFALGSRVVIPVTFATTASGTLEVTVDWTFASNDVDIFVARGSEPCTLETFNNRSCGFIATEESTTLKPEKLTIPNFAAGSYTLYVANFGATDESASYHLVLTTTSAASVRSVSTGATANKGRVNRIGER